MKLASIFWRIHHQLEAFHSFVPHHILQHNNSIADVQANLALRDPIETLESMGQWTYLSHLNSMIHPKVWNIHRKGGSKDDYTRSDFWSDGWSTHIHAPTAISICAIMTRHGMASAFKGLRSSHTRGSYSTIPPFLQYRRIQCPSAKCACAQFATRRFRSFLQAVLALGFMAVVLFRREIVSPWFDLQITVHDGDCSVPPRHSLMLCEVFSGVMDLMVLISSSTWVLAQACWECLLIAPPWAQSQKDSSKQRFEASNLKEGDMKLFIAEVINNLQVMARLQAVVTRWR